jgi:hypothetical protein
MNVWPFDEAYMIQQFHNWNSGYPKVTIQPGDLRSGFSGEKAFEENHNKWIYLLFKPFYWIWPFPETLILLYAFFVSLSVVTLYLFLKQLALDRFKIMMLVACWMLYPLQQRIVSYSYCDTLPMSGTFYFFYLYLLCRNSPYAILGCLGLLLPREQTVWLILPTMFLLPGKWKTLLWHLACMIPLILIGKTASGDPFAFADAHFSPYFISNFLLTQTILWCLVLVNPLGLVPAVGFMLIMIGVGEEIYFRFPDEYLGPIHTPMASFYYYGLFMPPMMAAVALGIAGLKAGKQWRIHLSLALLLLPGIVYGLCQLGYLGSMQPDVRQVEDFQAADVPADAVVVTDYALSAAFANRDQIYVYLQPPKGISLTQVFSLADVAIVRKVDSDQIEYFFFRQSSQQWRRIMESDNYLFYKKIR